MVSGSLAYNALGMCTVKEHKEHHAQYVLEKEQKSKDDKLQKKLDHGTQNKVTIILNTNGKHKMLLSCSEEFQGISFFYN